MKAEAPGKDLIALVADKNMEHALRGLLNRPQSLGIRPLKEKRDYDIFVHPHRDPGCLAKSPEFLRPWQRTYGRALVMFDREGCGREAQSRLELETDMEQQLARSGWDERAAVVIIDPELENWVWSNSPLVDRALGWTGRSPDLRQWLLDEGFLKSAAEAKPTPPKPAMDRALRIGKKPHSSSLFQQLAETVSLSGCTDDAFLKLRRTLTGWFPPSAAEN